MKAESKIQSLPEPNVDVFVKYKGTQMLARRRVKGAGRDVFVPAFPARAGLTISVNEIDAWDYAVPAGDMLYDK